MDRIARDHMASLDRSDRLSRLSLKALGRLKSTWAQGSHTDQNLIAWCRYNSIADELARESRRTALLRMEMLRETTRRAREVSARIDRTLLPLGA